MRLLPVLLLAFAPNAFAQQPWQLTEPVPASRARSISPAALSAVRVALAPSAIDAATPVVDLQLPDGRPVRALRQSGEQRGADNYHWLGWVDGDAEQQVSLTRVGDQMSAYLSLRDGVFELTPTRDGPLLMQIDTERFPACGGAPIDHAPESAVFALPEGSTTLIDVLVVVSPSSTSLLGGQPQAQTFAQSAVDSANTAFQNSQMTARFRLAGVRFTARADSGSSSTDLSWVRNDPEVAAWRNEVGADMVGMISEFSNACGQGYLMSSPGPGFAGSAYQVTARGCAVGNLSYAHEHGHNMGLHHDPANGSGSSYPYAYGHFVDGNYRTVLSYSTECTQGCTRRPYFSNPNVVFQGAATGIADQRDNARAGNQTAAIVAAFRAGAWESFANGFE